jgi:hypothetical protein
MAEKADKQNRRAENVNPLRSGVRTGNPQLRARNHGTSEQKAAKRVRRPAAKAKRQP